MALPNLGIILSLLPRCWTKTRIKKLNIPDLEVSYSQFPVNFFLVSTEAK